MVKDDGEWKTLYITDGKLEVVGLGDFKCPKCGTITSGLVSDDGEVEPPYQCSKCKRKKLVCASPNPIPSGVFPELEMPVAPNSFEDLYKEIRDYLKIHVIFPYDVHYDVVTCWVLMSWKIECFESTPYLLFLGVHDSGKTRALDILNILSHRAHETASVTPAATILLTDRYHSTLLIDQAEDMLNRKWEGGAVMYSVVAGGYKRGSKYTRQKEGVREIEAFDIFGAKAMASIESWDEAINSRCIVFNMEESDKQVKDIDYDVAKELRRKLLWFRLFYPSLHGGSTNLSGRMHELFSPLIGVSMLSNNGGVSSDIEGFAEDVKRIRKGEISQMAEAEIISKIIQTDISQMNEQSTIDGEARHTEVELIGVREALGGKEIITAQKIAYKLRDMGIERKRNTSGRAVVDCGEMLEKLMYYVKKFGIEDVDEEEYVNIKKENTQQHINIVPQRDLIGEIRDYCKKCVDGGMPTVNVFVMKAHFKKEFKIDEDRITEAVARLKSQGDIEEVEEDEIRWLN